MVVYRNLPSIRRWVRTFLVSWGQTTRVKHCYVDLSSSYEFWFPIIFIDMNVIHQIVETVSIASMCQDECQHGPHWESFFFFFLLKYNNSNSSTGECVWIKWWTKFAASIKCSTTLTSYAASPRAQAELAQCQHVGAWVDSACMSVHDSFVIDGQNSNRI